MRELKVRFALKPYRTTPRTPKLASLAIVLYSMYIFTAHEVWTLKVQNSAQWHIDRAKRIDRSTTWRFFLDETGCGGKYTHIYKTTRVYSSFSLVENRDLLQAIRKRLTSFQWQANHRHFRTVNSQWRALFCVDHDHVD